jgi:hypothetical protein
MLNPGYGPRNLKNICRPEAFMRTTLFATLLLASPLVAGTATAQPFPFSEAGVTNGHWHLNSKDRDQRTAWPDVDRPPNLLHEKEGNRTCV